MENKMSKNTLRQFARPKLAKFHIFGKNTTLGAKGESPLLGPLEARLACAKARKAVSQQQNKLVRRERASGFVLQHNLRPKRARAGTHTHTGARGARATIALALRTRLLAMSSPSQTNSSTTSVAVDQPPVPRERERERWVFKTRAAGASRVTRASRDGSVTVHGSGWIEPYAGRPVAETTPRACDRLLPRAEPRSCSRTIVHCDIGSTLVSDVRSAGERARPSMIWAPEISPSQRKMQNGMCLLDSLHTLSNLQIWGCLPFHYWYQRPVHEILGKSREKAGSRFRDSWIS